MRDKEKNGKKKDFKKESEERQKRRKKDYKQKYDHPKYWLEESSSDLSLE